MLLSAYPVAARAQGEGAVRGQVLANAGGVPLAGVTVSLLSVPFGTLFYTKTDAEGYFGFQHVRPGEYVIATRPDGFTRRQVRFVLEPREVRIVTLKPDIERIGLSVEVRAPAPRSEGTHSPSSTVLDKNWLESIPIAQRAHLADVLVSSAPGMVRADNDFVHVRGHEIGLAVLINGVTFWENPLPAYSGGIGIDIIDTANVMTGGFSAEYGNRFGGVIDIVTKSGFTMKDHGSARLSAGDERRGGLSAEFGGHGDRFGYFGSGSFFSSDTFQNPPDRDSIHNGGRGAHVSVQGDVSLGAAGALRALVMGDGAGYDIPLTRVDAALRANAAASQDIRQQTAMAGYTRAMSDFTVGATFYQRWSRSHLLPAAGPLTASAEVDRRLSTAGGKVDVTWFSGRHVLKAGVDAVQLRPEERLFYDYSGYGEFLGELSVSRLHFTGPVHFFARETGGQFSLYVQDTIQMSNRLTLDAGLRIDRYNLAGSATRPSPRINVAFGTGPFVLHASYNRFFVPPPVEGVLSSSAGLTSRIEEIGRALPTIEPATEDQMELGASSALGVLQFSLSGYYRASENAVHTTVWPDSRIYGHASFDRVRAGGLEVKVGTPGLAHRGISGWINYALGRIYYYNPVTGGFVTEADHVTGGDRFLAPMDQTHTLTAGLTLRHSRTGVWGAAMLDYGSGTPMHVEDEEAVGARSDPEPVSRAARHLVAALSLGADLIRDSHGRSRLSVRCDLENVTNNVYLIAQEEAAFGPALFSRPRLVSVATTLRF